VYQDLLLLRDRYRADHDLFSARELAYLRFLRWLQQTDDPAVDTADGPPQRRRGWGCPLTPLSPCDRHQSDQSRH
jgi:hypothetical protein